MPFGQGGLDTVSVNDGTVVYSGTPPGYVTGINGGQAISLTGGSGQYVSLPDTPTGPLDVYLGNAFTFECYFKLTSLPSSGTAILARRDQTWALGVTSAGDVTLTVSGVTNAIAAGVTLSTGTWYHVAAVYTGFANTWYLLVNGAAPASPPVAGYDGGTADPADQSIGGDGTSNGTFPGAITEARVSAIARYPASAYTPPTPPLAADAGTLANYSMNATVQNTGVLTLAGLGGGGPGSASGFTVGLTPGTSLTDDLTVNLTANGTTTGLSPSTVTLTTSQPSATFTFTPQSGQVGTDIPIAATSSSASPATVNFHVYTGSAYTIAVAAPYGITSTGMATQLGYWIYDPADPANALRWAPGTAGITEQAPGTGVYMTLVKAEPAWTRVLVWDSPYGTNPFITVLNPQ